MALKQGGIIAYPTESVFGLGCSCDDIAAIKSLLSLKKRDKNKGLILIASDFSQLEGYINWHGLPLEMKKAVLASWPGPITWIMPTGKKVSSWLSGQYHSIAVRVSDHPDVQALCRAYGQPITSTSANLSGMPPCLTYEEALNQFGDSISFVLKGKTQGREKPTEIRDACSGKILRHG